MAKAITQMGKTGTRAEELRRDVRSHRTPANALTERPRPYSAALVQKTASSKSAHRPASAALLQRTIPSTQPLRGALEYHAEQLCLGMQKALPDRPSVASLQTVLREMFQEIEAEQQIAASPASQAQVHALEDQVARLTAKLDAISAAKADSDL